MKKTKKQLEKEIEILKQQNKNYSADLNNMIELKNSYKSSYEEAKKENQQKQKIEDDYIESYKFLREQQKAKQQQNTEIIKSAINSVIEKIIPFVLKTDKK